jgi:hypothetical protein
MDNFLNIMREKFLKVVRVAILKQRILDTITHQNHILNFYVKDIIKKFLELN